MILTYADAKDQRVVQADRRIDAIYRRIEAERNGDGERRGARAPLPDVVGDYEALRVDLQIASTAYTHSLAGLVAAEAEAQRQSRYLAPHIQPTMAQESLYPRAPDAGGDGDALPLPRLGRSWCSSTTMCATTTAERSARPAAPPGDSGR